MPRRANAAGPPGHWRAYGQRGVCFTAVITGALGLVAWQSAAASIAGATLAMVYPLMKRVAVAPGSAGIGFFVEHSHGICGQHQLLPGAVVVVCG